MSAHRPPTTHCLALALALVLAACSSTGIAESWVDPGTKTLPRFQKVFVAYLGADSAAQHLAEDSMAKHLEAREVVKSYALLPDARGQDPLSVKEQLRAAGCDGAVLMRLTRVSQEVSTANAVPADASAFGRYWGYGSALPMEVRTDEIVHVETSLYSLVEDKLLYSASSESFNPGSTAELIDEIAEAVAADLRKKGLRR